MILALVFILAFIQQVASAIGSRARNRNKRLYHLPFSFLSHLFFGLTLWTGFEFDISIGWLVVYVSGATLGNMAGAEIAMKIEPRIKALADHWQ